MIVNYTLPPEDSRESLSGALWETTQDYAVDLDSVVSEDIADNSTVWDVDQVIYYYYLPNGTLGGRYLMVDYWFQYTREREEVDTVSMALFAADTHTEWQFRGNGGWDHQNIYAERFNESLSEVLEDVEHISVNRHRRTIFVRLNSTAPNRSTLQDQLRRVNGVYKGIHDRIFTESQNSYEVPTDAQPRIIDVEVAWQDHGDYLMGRLSGSALWGENPATSTEPTAGDFYRAFRNGTILERGRFRDQP
jgi:hypothetical protein